MKKQGSFATFSTLAWASILATTAAPMTTMIAGCGGHSVTTITHDMAKGGSTGGGDMVASSGDDLLGSTGTDDGGVDLAGTTAAPDLAGADLAGADLTTVAAPDLLVAAGADLAGQPPPDLSTSGTVDFGTVAKPDLLTITTPPDLSTITTTPDLAHATTPDLSTTTTTPDLSTHPTVDAALPTGDLAMPVGGVLPCGTLGARDVCPAGMVCDQGATGLACFATCALGDACGQAGFYCSPVYDSTNAYTGLNDCYPDTTGAGPTKSCSSGRCRYDNACDNPTGTGATCTPFCIAGGPAICPAGQVCLLLPDVGHNLGDCYDISQVPADAGTPDLLLPVDAAAPDLATGSDAGVVTVVDAAGSDAPVVTTGDGGSADINGTGNFVFHLQSTSTTTPIDFSTVTVQALVAGSGGYTTYPGSGGAGTFTIPGVPQGPYVLQIGSAYIFTSARAPIYDIDEQGRADVTPVSLSTRLTVTQTGIDAWSTSDSLELYSAGADVYMPDLQDYASRNAPAAGDTSINGMRVDWSTISPAPNLIEGSEGDVLYLTQMSGHTKNGVSYTTPTEVTQFTTLNQTDGLASTLTGAATAVPQTEKVTVDFRGSQFDALTASVNPTATSSSATFYLAAYPYGTTSFYSGVSGDLLFFGLAAGSVADVNLGALNYGNPYPTAWGEVGAAYETFSVAEPVEFETDAAVTGTIINFASPATFSGGPIKPGLSPVQHPLVNTNDAFTAQAGVTDTPTLSWSAPATGTPTYYFVNVMSLGDDGTGTGTGAATSVAYFITKDTSLVVPTGILLTDGTAYCAVITATDTKNDLSTSPNQSGFPYNSADAITATFLP